MKTIKMYASARIPFKEEYDMKTLSPSIGVFEFRYGDDTIPFDFDTISSNYTKLDDSIEIEWNNDKSFLSDYYISEDYRYEISEAGYDIDELTAEFLSNVDEITEIFTDIVVKVNDKFINIEDTPVFTEISFSDDTGTVYKVKEDVIDNFNKKSKECTV